jgi:hypothetical protein
MGRKDENGEIRAVQGGAGNGIGYGPHFRRVLSFLTVFAALADAQTAIELARKAPPELFADAVIKLVERGELPPSALAEAFDAAKQAKEPVKLVALPQLVDGRPAMREAALRADVDALSLQARVVTLMARTDADKAREMFQSIDHPLLERRSCEDPMVADDSGPGSAPGELASFAKLLHTTTALTADEFRVLLGALALKMQSATADYRGFSMTAEALWTELDGVMARARELGVPTDALAEGVRKFTVTQLGTPRCHEELRDAIRFVDWFNHGIGKKLDPIRADETVSRADLGSAKAEGYFQSGSGKDLSDRFQRLRAARGKPEWGMQLAEFLKAFAAWKPDGTEMDGFHQRMTVLHGLYQAIPDGEDRDKLMARTVEFLKGSEIQRQYPAEWLFQVRSFAESALNGKAKLMAAFRESGDAGLVLFERLKE